MRSLSDAGIVLARRNYGEADRILVLYTKSHGKLSLLAKGVRYPKSKKRGHIEVFSALTFQASEAHGMPLMTEAEVFESFNKVRGSLKKVAVAYYFCEVVGRVTREGERHEEVYTLLFSYLNALMEAKNTKDLRLEFIEKLLTLLGFWPKGKALNNPDEVLEEIVEKKLSSYRVGKKLVS